MNANCTPLKIHAAVLPGALLLLLPGCASVISGRHTEVSIDSCPSKANVAVYNRRGEMVASAQTPARVTLRRGDSWFRPGRYTAAISKPGYETAHVPLRAGVNPWVLGNVVFGGIAGLVIDPFTGAAWRLPSEVRHDLAPMAGPQIAQGQTPPALPPAPSDTRIASADASLVPAPNRAYLPPSPVEHANYPSSEWNGPTFTR